MLLDCMDLDLLFFLDLGLELGGMQDSSSVLDFDSASSLYSRCPHSGALANLRHGMAFQPMDLIGP